MPNTLAKAARNLILGGTLLAQAGCSSYLTGAGPSTGDIEAQSQSATPGVPRYEIVDIDSRTVDVLRKRRSASFLARFGDYRPSVEPTIGVGDTVSVTIWEAGAGGLFSAPLSSDRFSTGSKSSTIPDQVVGRDGSISVPYAGRVRVVGRTPKQVQAELEQALTGKAIEPQTLVNVPKSVSNSVTVTGEVVNGARVPLSVRGDRVMDVIATAGGVRAPVNETFIQLTRGRETARVAMSRVSTDASENIYMRPNDVLTVVRDPQTFIAYGATGRNAEIPFDADGISLAQALAKAGGLSDGRSDPSGVFVFRFEPESVARAVAPGTTIAGPGRMTPVVYRLNLRDPGSLFLSQAFRIESRDVLYVSNAPINDTRKVMEVVGLVTGPALAGLTAYSLIER
ncbi:polysaccharide biosynthesis/export family protein [Methylocella sp.]|uniref:polysaccharide biosynthesis/export family protein n=1 Tax=Methylocella sp. TaxID=1978226 RepID=UPI003783AC4A